MKNNKSVLALFLEFHLRPLSLCHVATTLIKIFQSHFLFFLIHFSSLIRSQQQRKKKDASRHLTKCKYKFSRVRSYLSIKVSWYSFVYSASLHIEIRKSFLSSEAATKHISVSIYSHLTISHPDCLFLRKKIWYYVAWKAF